MTAAAAAIDSTSGQMPRPEWSASPQDEKGVLTERARIDKAASGPVLVFFSTAVAWLILSTILGLVISIKHNAPSFLADLAPLTYGRLVPACRLCLTYGWASLAGMGVGIWILSRLCRVPLRLPGVLIFGAILWNLGLVLGVGAVLSGKMSTLDSLEMPIGPSVVLFSGYLIIGGWGAVLYRSRIGGAAYVSVWYILGAFFWFSWYFGVSQFLTSICDVQGVMQNVVGAWYHQGVSLLWLGALGLGTAYYLIPKVINRPIYSSNLASVGFWTFVAFAGLTGLARLSGGPVPAWIVSVGIAANLLMLVPLATVLTNLLSTIRSGAGAVYFSPTLRFTTFGVVSFGVSGVIALMSSLRSVDSAVHFTQFAPGQEHLFLYCFYSMVMFGAIYYIMPRLVGCEWLSSSLIRLHFYGAAYGGGFFSGLLLLAGVATGLSLRDPEASFLQAVQISQSYYLGQTFAVCMIAVGHLFFLLHFLLMLLRIGQPGADPTLFSNPGEEKH